MYFIYGSIFELAAFFLDHTLEKNWPLCQWLLGAGRSIVVFLAPLGPFFLGIMKNAEITLLLFVS